MTGPAVGDVLAELLDKPENGQAQKGTAGVAKAATKRSGPQGAAPELRVIELRFLQKSL